jgi:hypothetical protein
MSMTLSFVDER